MSSLKFCGKRRFGSFTGLGIENTENWENSQEFFENWWHFLGPSSNSMWKTFLIWTLRMLKRPEKYLSKRLFLKLIFCDFFFLEKFCWIFLEKRIEKKFLIFFSRFSKGKLSKCGTLEKKTIWMILIYVFPFECFLSNWKWWIFFSSKFSSKKIFCKKISDQKIFTHFSRKSRLSPISEETKILSLLCSFSLKWYFLFRENKLLIFPFWVKKSRGKKFFKTWN